MNLTSPSPPLDGGLVSTCISSRLCTNQLTTVSVGQLNCSSNYFVPISSWRSVHLHPVGLSNHFTEHWVAWLVTAAAPFGFSRPPQLPINRQPSPQIKYQEIASPDLSSVEDDESARSRIEQWNSMISIVFSGLIDIDCRNAISVQDGIDRLPVFARVLGILLR